MNIDLEKTEISKNDSLSKDQIISLLGVYLDEWKHRDEVFWAVVFRLFYATLLVTVLPHVAQFIGIELPVGNDCFFPVVGIIMASICFYIGFGYALRLKASGITYRKIMNELGEEKYFRVSISDKKFFKIGKLFMPSMVIVMVVLMYIALLFIAIMLLIV